ncbi:ankyrin repeat domain-containing protein [Aspergillus alliaceus]|uniref:ankyrin repeat domain-containing protein n=1 Tax=Petromyces alliaceus TaxID=209559 RepID=UPI0012A4176D|nr:uncharacterized protein BDW43DRAFT_312377 [Aspergillus alliaceus]KAB8232053.1 hypothetical protein BDW43DRAFT_312377 [Aspergillus alliaceus]
MATPIYYASLAGLHYTVELPLGKGADVNTEGGELGNALQAGPMGMLSRLLLLEGYNKTVQLLLEKGADINAEGWFYGNALQAASSRGHNEFEQLLLDKGANVNTQGGEQV